ncbi:MAG TPA: 1-deoxy-D-xylulose-5-phosphate synthase [Acidimicrobiales bacterium]|nr:1-deoxy-D-xylulose-5-phosphate synthase [Acidimicrobiales bacterium]
MILDSINSPSDIKALSAEELATLCGEIRSFIVDAVTTTGGHLGSNLGAVELTLAIHRVFDSPSDIILWDTGHQAYVHKILTGRKDLFPTLRQEGGLSGYPNRDESPHDWVENSHASTILSYAHGFATALNLQSSPQSTPRALAGTHGSINPLESGVGDSGDQSRISRNVVAVIGDGALTGGMAYEALNNLGHSRRRCIIVLNDNGRSYAPTISRLSESITKLRLNPAYVHTRQRLKQMLKDLPAVGGIAYTSVHGMVSALREMVEPHVFFESLGVRYTGPIDGHDIEGMEHALRNASEWEDGPIVVHVLTEKGHGYGPAVEDEVHRLHDLKIAAAPQALSPKDDTSTERVPAYPRRAYTEVFTESLIELAADDPRIVAITAAMPGPTGLLPFQERFPERFFDVGIAEQHAVTAAAGMAMAGLRPVVAVYSTFFSRAFDQANLDVGLHGLPVTFVFDRAGITGDDGASHHGVLDMALCLAIPNLAIFAPSSTGEVPVMLASALSWEGPSAVRFPKTPARVLPANRTGTGMKARLVSRTPDTNTSEPLVRDCAILAIGKMVEPAEEAAEILATSGISNSLWDVRVVRPADPEMIADAAAHKLVVTVEDGIRTGGAGSYLADLVGELDRGLSGPPVLRLGTPIEYISHAKPDMIHSHLGLDGPGIARAILKRIAPEQVEAIGLESSADSSNGSGNSVSHAGKARARTGSVTSTPGRPATFS